MSTKRYLKISELKPEKDIACEQKLHESIEMSQPPEPAAAILRYGSYDREV